MKDANRPFAVATPFARLCQIELRYLARRNVNEMSNKNSSPGKGEL
jgi:hypothetical protein